MCILRLKLFFRDLKVWMESKFTFCLDHSDRRHGSALLKGLFTIILFHIEGCAGDYPGVVFWGGFLA
jgi:hypothetical protein